MPLTVFTQRNFAADFLGEKSNFLYGKRKKIVIFEAAFRGLGAKYAVHLRLIGKLVGDFLLIIIEVFFASCYACGATSEYRLESAV